MLQRKDLGHTRKRISHRQQQIEDVHGRSRRPTIINEVQTYASVIFGFL